MYSAARRAQIDRPTSTRYLNCTVRVDTMCIYPIFFSTLYSSPRLYKWPLKSSLTHLRAYLMYLEGLVWLQEEVDFFIRDARHRSWRTGFFVIEFPSDLVARRGKSSNTRASLAGFPASRYNFLCYTIMSVRIFRSSWRPSSRFPILRCRFWLHLGAPFEYFARLVRVYSFPRRYTEKVWNWMYAISDRV